MKMNFVDKYNALIGLFVAIATALLGEYWYLFLIYLIFNITDWLTGWYKSRKLGTESSWVGLIGILKKMGYWIIILAAFLLPTAFVKFGNDILGINLSFMMLFGWYTLACLLVNEVRSVLENLVECGYKVPNFLIKGLAVTEKLLQSKTDDLT